MVQPGEVREGMKVLTSDGRHVGRVTGIGDVHFELEPGGLPMPRRDFLVDYRDVASVRDREVVLEATARLELEVDDDGGALPPRSHANVDREPVNAEESLPSV
jgi:hypothetical protein